MGVADVPQWLPAAFTRSVIAAGATASKAEIEETCNRLLDRWREPDRHFHNVRHLVDVLARVDELAEETHDPELVRLAAWYHGAVFSSTPSKAYSRSGGEDEETSAELARGELSALGVPERTIERIAELITNLKRHEGTKRDIDCLALCDADLATLAADPQRYRAYREAVRKEYAHLPVRHYLEARKAIVSKLLARRHLFLSPMGAQWEDRARDNLTAELARLEAELARLGDAPPEESVVAAEAARGEKFDDDAPREPVGETTGHLFNRPSDVAQVPSTRLTSMRSPELVPVGGVRAMQPAPRLAGPDTAAGAGPGAVAGAGTAEPRTEAGRSSSLESMPDELDRLRAFRRPVDDAGRDHVVQVQHAQIEDAVRADRPEDRPAEDIPAASWQDDEAPAAPTREVPTAEVPERDVPPREVPSREVPEPDTGSIARIEPGLLSGIEREPDYFAGRAKKWRERRAR